MRQTFDVIVLGVGGVGSAALMHLARRGLRVLGLDRFPIGHDRGSSHGEKRIIRKAYFEHPDYVPLLHRAYDLWEDLEQKTGQSLYVPCGLFLSGPPEGEVVAGAKTSARQHGLRLDELTVAEARDRFRLFEFPDDHAIVFEPEAGYLLVEDAVRAHVGQAQAAGASVHIAAVRDWQVQGGTVRILTDQETYEAASLVVAAGAWAGSMLHGLGFKLEVMRQVQFWHGPLSTDWQQTPAFFFQLPQGCFYGFPASTSSETGECCVKLAEHTGGVPVHDPLQVERDLLPEDTERTTAFVRDWLNDLESTPRRHSVCMYTMSADGHFLVDRHPEHDEVIFAAGLSGHGYKFTSVLGEALGDLVVAGQTDLPIGFLGCNRRSLGDLRP